MSGEIPWLKLSEFLADNFALHFPVERQDDLRRGLQEIAREFGFPSVAACWRWISTEGLTTKQRYTIASYFTVGETYFFREKSALDILVESVLPEIIARRRKDRRLAIWSVACSTGEEPYTLAILARQLIPDLKEWNVQILATDISERSLQKAREGIYTEWSFREAPAWLKGLHFQSTEDGKYAIAPEIRKQVTFLNENLLESPPLRTGFDLIVCRNVLMYFKQAQARKIVAGIYGALDERGWLLTGPSEAYAKEFSQFHLAPFQGVFFYQKGGIAAKKPRMAAEQGSAPWTPALAPVVHKARKPHEAKKPEIAKSKQPAPNFSEIARDLANQGKLAEANGQCEQWIKADKMDPSAHYVHAVILQELGRGDEARRALSKAIYLREDFVMAYFALGNMARESGKDRESKKNFANALRLLQRRDPGDLLEEADGLTAGRLAEMISSIAKPEPIA